MKDTKNNYDQESWKTSPYATSWLLTGIKGPDYVDRGTSGYSSDDWGYWIHFRYSMSNELSAWRSPYSGFKESPNEPHILSYSEGIKNKLYLESIESASHIAQFNKEDRLDNLPSNLFNIDVNLQYKKKYGINEDNLYIKFDQEALETIEGETFSIDLKLAYSSDDRVIVAFNGDYVDYNEVVPATYTFNKSDFDSDGWIRTPQPYTATLSSTSIFTYWFKDNPSKIYEFNTVYFEPINVRGSIRNVNSTVPLSTERFSKKLNNVKVYKKAINLITKKTDYSHDYQLDQVLEAVKFDYNYSLLRNSPNSEATFNGDHTGELSKGKLTLKSISKLGLNNTQILPTTEFKYNGEGLSHDDGTEYNKDYWDHWNGYSSTGHHYNYKTEENANNDAGMLNLKSIHTPLGSTIKVDYESDKLTDIENKTYPLSLYVNQRIVPSIKIVNLSITYSTIISVEEEFPLELFYDQFKQNNKTVIITTEDFSDATKPATYSVSTEIEISDIDLSNKTIEFSTLYTAPELRSIVGFLRKYNFKLKDLEPTLYAGGHRVKSITLEYADKMKKTKYDYQEASTFSLPSAYKGYGPIISDDFNQLGPGPAVGYGAISIFEVDESDQILNAKSTHRYWTAKDLALTYGASTIDKSGIIGRMKEIEVEGMDNNGNFYPVRIEKFNYAYSSELMNDNSKGKQRVFKNNFNTKLSANKPLGLTLQNYKSENDADSDNPEVNITMQKENIFLLGTETEIYHYDADWQELAKISRKSENLAFDAQTGNVIRSEVLGSKGGRFIAEKIPAYWKYDEMKQKNMFSQLAQNNSYYVPTTEFFDTEIDNQYLLSSSVTTWAKWDEAYENGDLNAVDPLKGEKGLWRQNDTYTWIGEKGTFKEFHSGGSTRWTDEDPGDFITIVGIQQWKRTSNITAYDRFSHPVEERGLDGNYTSSIYGHGDALPTAIAKNAKRSQIRYYDFEAKNRNAAVYPLNDVTKRIDWAKQRVNARTGEYSATATEAALKLVPSEEGITYQVSYWYYKDSKWQYHEYDGATASSAVVVIAGALKVDDIKIHPINATMSTFTYDPLTWKVTSITDANGNSSYYEYDEAGRLIKVLDQDQYLKAAYDYSYGKGTN
jgi:YD repeat-containing protein